MENKKDKFADSVFIVINEKSCPYYDFGDELIVKNSSLSILPSKPVCLYLARKIAQIATLKGGSSRLPRLGLPQNLPGRGQSKHDCGGCTGLIHFEFKHEKGYVTLQMNLLEESEQQRRRNHLSQFYNMMRELDIFNSLEDDSLKSLTLFLEFKTLAPEKVLIKKGAPGTHLYIILTGQVAVLDDNNIKTSEIHAGGIFGEMSLLSDEPESNPLHTIKKTQVAMLSVKNFRHILKKHPTLQIFLFKLLIARVQMRALQSGNIASGMTGDLEEIAAVDLMQLINSSQKTGSIEFSFLTGNANIYFNEGEIVHAKFNNLQGKDAVYALMGIQEGLFAYNRGIPNEFKELAPIGGFIGLMMEGVQRLDEKNQQ